VPIGRIQSPHPTTTPACPYPAIQSHLSISGSSRHETLGGQDFVAIVSLLAEGPGTRRTVGVGRNYEGCDARGVRRLRRPWGTIEQELGRSRFFVLLASTVAARSKCVSREVEYWFTAKDPRTLLIALTDGDICWDESRNDFDWTRTTALPSAFVGQFPDGEPLWVDLRPHSYAKPTLDDPNFQDAVATLAATIHGKGKSDLVGEELRQ
jgi:hypothetical protein